MFHRNTVEEFMRFKEDLIFTGVNLIFIFEYRQENKFFFFIKVVYFNNFSILTHRSFPWYKFVFFE